MKNLLLIIIIISPFFLFAQIDIYPGMQIDEFRKKMPERIPHEFPFNETLTKKDKINNVNGIWTFQFVNNKLNEITFLSDKIYLSYPTDLYEIKNQNTYKESNEQVKKIFSYYNDKYGSANENLNNEFNLNPENPNYTEDIKTKTWNLAGAKISVKQVFSGDNQNYFKTNNAELSLYSFFIKIEIKPCKRGEKKHKENFYIGMDVKDFAKNIPELFPSGLKENGQSEYNEILYGIEGKWSYNFKNDSLENYNYSFYVNNYDDLTEENFNKCLNATEKLINKYKEYYGEPNILNTGKKEFIDPLVKHHWGYDVLEAKWKKNKLLCSIKFKFFGGKEEYFFLVSIDYYKPGYKYF